MNEFLPITFKYVLFLLDEDVVSEPVYNTFLDTLAL